MAVVQISRIQIRRGRRNSDTGLPQLASGELAWAIDTQELYIGNGAVSEGAPFVGNTKILTENDNILDLALQYQYLVNDTSIQTGATSAEPIRRSLQERLDETVSIRSFGAVGDGETNDTAAIQRALDQLYINQATNGLPESRVSLYFPAGEYIINGTIKLPPYTSIVGAGIDKTIFTQTADAILIDTVNSSSTPGDYDSSPTTEFNQTTSIDLSGMTLKGKSGYLILRANSIKNSKFNKIKFQGEWEPGDSLIAAEAGLELRSLSEQITSSNNRFLDCDFQNLSYAIQSTYDIDGNIFENCYFRYLGMGLYFGYDITSVPGKTFGPRRTKISSSTFLDIDRQGIYIVKGKQNISFGNTFIRVGNDGGTSNEATYAVIQCNETGNISDNDQFERSTNLASNNPSYVTSPYIGEYSGNIIGNHKFNNSVSVSETLSFIPIIRLAGYANASYKVHYIYTSSVANIVRSGTMSITADLLNQNAQLVDEYDYLVADDSSARLQDENLEFTVSLDDVDASGGIPETVTINYRNTTPSDSGIVRYWYEVLS